MYIRSIVMVFEWDPAKAKANLQKHGVRFADAVVALEDPRALTIPDLTSEGENRFVSIGLDAEARVLLTVYTHRSDRIRIISCRGATPAERRFYEEY